MVTKKRNSRAEGRLVEVVRKSPDEVCAPCTHFGRCGGCTYLNLPYDKQLELKAGQVKRLLDPVLAKQSAGWTFEGIKGSPVNEGYRNKMEFSFGNEYKDGPLTLGMHKRGSFFDIVPVEDCLIVDGDYRLILRTVREYFAEKGTPFFHRMTHQGWLRHLLVRKSKAENAILVALVTTTQIPDDQELIQGFTQRLLALTEKEDGIEWLEGNFAGILHVLNDSPADVVKCDRMDVLYGADGFGEKLLGLDFQVSTFSFFQTNSAGAEVIYRTVQRYVEEAGYSTRALDEGDGGKKKNRWCLTFIRERVPSRS